MTELIEGIDFYVENDRYVFTSHYLLKQGYCCQSKCRHCPYVPKHGIVTDDTEKKDLPESPITKH